MIWEESLLNNVQTSTYFPRKIINAVIAAKGISANYECVGVKYICKHFILFSSFPEDSTVITGEKKRVEL